MDSPLPLPLPTLTEAVEEVRLNVARFCLLAGIEALQSMMEEDATAVCGARYRRHPDHQAYPWGTTVSEVACHGGKVKMPRPRVRDLSGKEVILPSWEARRDPNVLR